MADYIRNLKRYNGSSWIDMLPTSKLAYIKESVQSSYRTTTFVDAHNTRKQLYTLEYSGFGWKPSMVIAFNDPAVNENTIYTCTISIYSSLTYYYVLEGYYDRPRGFIQINGTACIEKGRVVVPVSWPDQYILQLYGGYNT